MGFYYDVDVRGGGPLGFKYADQLLAPSHHQPPMNIFQNQFKVGQGKPITCCSGNIKMQSTEVLVLVSLACIGATALAGGKQHQGGGSLMSSFLSGGCVREKGGTSG